ncbi:hypothetical protein GCM10010191_25790 [Actinomadura vinacea]|uniref:EcsC family protein n=1 Tax=Actinomadura vinacea TaxID=115336 RepID=A0ABN3IUU3_9ACTN
MGELERHGDDHGAEREPDLVPESADGSAEIGELIGRLSGGEDLDRETRGRLLGRLARLLGQHARKAGAAGVARGRWLTELLVAAAPHIPVRDLETLSEHHHGLTGEELADNVVRVATNATTAVGAAAGTLAAAEFAAPPLLLTAPAQLAAETLVVAAIEVKMIAELHEVYGVRVDGSGATRGAAFLTSWAKQRGINPLEAGSFTSALGSAAKSALRKRLLRALGRSMTTLGPFLTGAAAGAALNRAATKGLAAAVRKDLAGDLATPAPLPGPYPAPALGRGKQRRRRRKP